MTDRPPKTITETLAPTQYWPGASFKLPLYRMTDLPHGFKASDQDRRKE